MYLVGEEDKVRIIGLHDQGQETIPDDQLPWANVMYPITAGGGQTMQVKHQISVREICLVFS